MTREKTSASSCLVSLYRTARHSRLDQKCESITMHSLHCFIANGGSVLDRGIVAVFKNFNAKQMIRVNPFTHPRSRSEEHLRIPSLVCGANMRC